LDFIFLAMLLAGCSAHKQKHAKTLKPLPTAPPAPVVMQKEEQMTFQQQQARHPAREGRLPLVYLLESPANVEVVDADDGSVIARANLSERSIISIDATNGVRGGPQQLANGPLAAQHTYQIFVTTGTDNTYRTELVTPGSGK